METGKKMKDLRDWLTTKVNSLGSNIRVLKAVRAERKEKTEGRELLAFEEEIGNAMGQKSAFQECASYLLRHFRNELKAVSQLPKEKVSEK